MCCPAGMLGVPPAQLESPGFDTLTRLITQPGEQARELQQALLSALNTSDPAVASAAADVAVGVVDQVAQTLAGRAALDVDTLFPMRQLMLQAVSRRDLGAASSQSSITANGTAAVEAALSSSSSISESNLSIPTVMSSGSSSSSDMVMQEARQPVLAAAGSSVNRTNGRVLRMRQL